MEQAGTLAGAIALLRAQPWDVVIADLGLPDSSGAATLAALSGHGARVIPISGSPPSDVEGVVGKTSGVGALMDEIDKAAAGRDGGEWAQRVLVLEERMRRVEGKVDGISAIAANVELLVQRDAEERRAWLDLRRRLVDCVEGLFKELVVIAGGLLGSTPIRWALAAAIITAIPGAAGTFALMQSAGPAVVHAVMAEPPASPEPVPTDP